MSKSKNIKFIGYFACVLVVILDIIAFYLGNKANEAESNAKHIRIIFFECKGRSRDAFVLGFTAAVSLGVAHFITVCISCCVFKHEAKSCCPLFLNILSWISCVIAAALLGFGAKSNYENSKVTCSVMSIPQSLYYGAIGCLAHLVFSLAYAASISGATPGC